MAERIPLCYTFGNHMHWVDMQWLWGYDVLSGSTDDMLAYCAKAGVKGNLNFDGIGFEKMAAESPEHLQKLREAVATGFIEVVGGSYGQPYGVFQGGESNVRQRIYGVRTCLRLLGARPRTFWEEEFDFYPQLPQILAGCGFTGASLYFQWTWHTPEIPMEDAPVIAWEGIDGTQIPTATRNRMNLHQWPEDFRILLDDLAANPPEAGSVPPLVLQWLELMPTQDWMCRSELMIPMLAELKQDPRFEVLATTLGGYLEKWKGQALPVRHYAMDEVWHGMTLGKNGDNHPKMSAMVERLLLRSETAAAILGLFGRPYEPWDVYPTWELEECWRLLLAAQHHDNHECEGLCGHVAQAQFAFIQSLMDRSDPVERLLRRTGLPSAIFNHLGCATSQVPAMGYSVVEDINRTRPWIVNDGVAEFSEGEFFVRIEIETARILEFRTSGGSIENLTPWFEFATNGQPSKTTGLDRPWGVFGDIESGELEIFIGPRSLVLLRFTPLPEEGALHLWVSVDPIPDRVIDPGYGGAVRMMWPVDQQ